MRGNDNKTMLAILALWLAFCVIGPMLSLSATSEEQATEETVEVVQTELVEEEIDTDLFVQLYYQDHIFVLYRFLPTDVIYLRHYNGNVQPLTDAEGNIITYNELLQLWPDLAAE